jgi:hypothetical protein
MNKMTSTLALITLAKFTAFAQPIATSADVPNNNFTAEFYFAPATNFSAGSAGANQTWDFSALNLTLAGTDTAIPVASSPYAATFPTANWCYKFTGFGPDRYYYHLVTPSKFEILSLAYTGATGDNYTADPRTFAIFPYTYNTVYNDTYKSVNDAATTSVVVTYDAYGTLIMPFGTIHNVIRQKVVKNGQTDYNWFNASPFYPILQTVLAENSLGIVKNTSILGVNQNKTDGFFTVTPNPTSGKLTINSAQNRINLLKISIFDIAGRQIMSGEKTGIGMIDVDLSNQKAGIYFLKIIAADGSTFIERIVKK